MTGHQINSLVGDLVAMAQAMERLPQVEAELDRTRTAVEDYAKQVQSREIRIISLKDELEAAQATIRSLEVARDDAELRFLEADDKLISTLDRLNQMGNIIRAVTNELDPPKPEPVVSEVKAIDNPLYDDPQIDDPSLPQGQSESDPIQATDVFVDMNSSATPTEGNVSMDNPPGPYHGRRYIDVHGWVSREDWLAGGGTNEDYDYRGVDNI